MHHAYLDLHAQGHSAVHRLDARAKILVTVGYTAVVISFGRYELAALAPLVIGPVAMLKAAGIPVSFALKRVAILSPFILMLCLLSPLYDRLPQAVAMGPVQWTLSGGWLTAMNIVGKFCLGILALTALMSTTPFSLLLEGLRRLGLPSLLVTQLGFLYRYIFVLIDESMRIRRARDFRGVARAAAGRRLAAVGGIIGSLFVRTMDRSERIHAAMCARGYDGQPRSLDRLRFRTAEILFLAMTAFYLVACRWLLPRILG